MVLKGGLVLELRLQKARMTKDVDTRFSGNPEQLLGRLQRAGRADLGDCMQFEVQIDRNDPDIQGEAAKYDGQRFRVVCKIAGKIYGDPFGLDVGIGDPMIREPDEVTPEDRLAVINVPPPRLRVYPIETHLAEKLHAYTLPRDRPNSRVKDLPDIALLSRLGPLKADEIYRALVQTFGFRGTHPIPAELPAPPDAWHQIYRQKTSDFDLEWNTLSECYERACSFINPVLAGERTSTWNPERGEWH